LYRIVLVLIVLILGSTLYEESSSAASISSDRRFIALGINDRVITYEKTFPFMSKNSSYAPSTFLSFLDVKSSTAGNMKIFKKDTITVTVDLSKLTVKRNGKTISVKALTKEGILYLPIRETAAAFGYQTSYISSGPLVRVENGTTKLTNTQLYQKYQTQIAKQKSKFYEAVKRVKATKVAYLTFDDGPNKYTGKILDSLKQNEAKATFFMLKGNMEMNSYVVKRMEKEGHSLACHGVTHKKEQFYLSPSSAVSEMNSCMSTLTNISGVTSKLIRVPYGSKPYMVGSYRQAMNAKGYRMWDWTVDSLDWKYKHAPSTVQHTINEIKRTGSSKKPMVILMHDRVDTQNYLQPLINYLKQNGYQLQPLKNSMTPYNFWQ
jgi:peptidoglycan-N-acetylglucosamine deacetylase